MTVNPLTFYALLWAFLLCAGGCLFFSSRLADYRERSDTYKRIIKHNETAYEKTLALFISGILTRANITDPLPPLNHSKLKTIIDLYNTGDLVNEDVPAQITTDQEDRPVVYWKHTSVNQLPAYELARLWLAGIL